MLSNFFSIQHTKHTTYSVPHFNAIKYKLFSHTLSLCYMYELKTKKITAITLTVRGAVSSFPSADLFSISADLFSVTKQDFLLVFVPEADGLFSLAFKKAFLAELRMATVDKE